MPKLKPLGYVNTPSGQSNVQLSALSFGARTAQGIGDVAQGAAVVQDYYLQKQEEAQAFEAEKIVTQMKTESFAQLQNVSLNTPVEETRDVVSPQMEIIKQRNTAIVNNASTPYIQKILKQRASEIESVFQSKVMQLEINRVNKRSVSQLSSLSEEYSKGIAQDPAMIDDYINRMEYSLSQSSAPESIKHDVRNTYKSSFAKIAANSHLQRATSEEQVDQVMQSIKNQSWYQYLTVGDMVKLDNEAESRKRVIINEEVSKLSAIKKQEAVEVAEKFTDLYVGIIEGNTVLQDVEDFRQEFSSNVDPRDAFAKYRALRDKLSTGSHKKIEGYDDLTKALEAYADGAPLHPQTDKKAANEFYDAIKDNYDNTLEGEDKHNKLIQHVSHFANTTGVVPENFIIDAERYLGSSDQDMVLTGAKMFSTVANLTGNITQQLSSRKYTRRAERIIQLNKYHGLNARQALDKVIEEENTPELLQDFRERQANNYLSESSDEGLSSLTNDVTDEESQYSQVVYKDAYVTEYRLSGDDTAAKRYAEKTVKRVIHKSVFNDTKTYMANAPELHYAVVGRDVDYNSKWILEQLRTDIKSFNHEKDGFAMYPSGYEDAGRVKLVPHPFKMNNGKPTYIPYIVLKNDSDDFIYYPAFGETSLDAMNKPWYPDFESSPEAHRLETIRLKKLKDAAQAFENRHKIPSNVLTPLGLDY